MKRRTFSQYLGLSAIASSLPVAIAACQSSSPPASDGTASSSTPIDSTPREDGFAAVGTVAELAEKGFISDKAFFAGAVLVIRDPSDDTSVVAVNSLCTHQGCSVAWDSDDSLFACPCHQSKFAVDGSVTAGPATDPLGKFEAIVDGDLVLVKAV